MSACQDAPFRPDRDVWRGARRTLANRAEQKPGQLLPLGPAGALLGLLQTVPRLCVARFRQLVAVAALALAIVALAVAAEVLCGD
jgi:hypothetical protein